MASRPAEGPTRSGPLDPAALRKTSSHPCCHARPLTRDRPISLLHPPSWSKGTRAGDRGLGEARQIAGSKPATAATTSLEDPPRRISHGSYGGSGRARYRRAGSGWRSAPSSPTTASRWPSGYSRRAGGKQFAAAHEVRPSTRATSGSPPTASGSSRGAGAARAARHPGQQRRHHHRPDGPQDVARGLGPGDRRTCRAPST